MDPKVPLRNSGRRRRTRGQAAALLLTIVIALGSIVLAVRSYRIELQQAKHERDAQQEHQRMEIRLNELQKKVEAFGKDVGPLAHDLETRGAAGIKDLGPEAVKAAEKSVKP